MEDHLELFVQVYKERADKEYRFCRPCFKKVISRSLECGYLKSRFAGVKYRDCHHEYLPAFCNSFLPSSPMAIVGEEG